MDPRLPLPGVFRMPSAFGFVGREVELGRLEACWAEASEGQRVVLVSGEAGAGKSRLLRELATTVFADHGTVLYGAGDPTSVDAYRVVIEALRPLLDGIDPARLAADLQPHGAELIRLFPDVVHRVQGLSAPAPAPPETERHLLHGAVVDLLANVSARSPTLLIIDDLQWADPSTLLLLRRLFVSRRDARILVVLALRDPDGDTDDRLTDLLADLARVPHVVRIPLGGLDHAAIANFVRLRDMDLGIHSDALAATLYELTAGNAFLLSELWQHLAGAGFIDTVNADSAAAVKIMEFGVPAGVRDIASQRLARMHPPTRTVLEAASAAGPQIDVTLLRGATVLDEVTLFDAVEEAVGANILQPTMTARPGYRFTHELLRRAVYDRLNPVARARLHLSIATALERMPGQELRLTELAAHFTAAAMLGVEQQAVSYNLRAAEVANHRLAFELSATLLQRALQLGVDETESLRVQLRLGAAQRAAGAWSEAIATYHSAADTARTAGTAALLAEAALGLEETCWRPGITSAGGAALLAEAVSAVGDSDRSLRVQLLSALARAHGYAGAWERASAARDAAVALARAVGEPRSLAIALAQSYWARVDRDPQEVLLAMEEGLQLAEGLRDRDLICSIQSRAVPMLAAVGSAQEVRDKIDEFRALADGLGQNIYRYHCDQASSAVALADGHLAEADAMAERALELSKLENYDAGGGYGIQMFGIRREQGRLGELSPLIKQLDRSTGVWRPGLAVLYAELDMKAEARSELAVLCADGFAEIPDDALEVAALTYLADAAVAVADRKHSELLYRRLADMSGAVLVISGLVAWYGSADRYLGALAHCMGDLEVAESHFERALATDRRLGLTTWRNRTRIHYAEMLRRRNAGGDASRAAELLAEAHRDAVVHDLPAIRNLTERQQRRPLSKTEPAGLTEREIDVLALLAEGRSNRDIGSALFITSNTTANHIRSILMKTGSKNRTEAAAFAHRHDLTQRHFSPRDGSTTIKGDS